MKVLVLSMRDYFLPKRKLLRNKEPTSERRESFDIFVSRILQPRLNDPLFSYYFKSLKY